MKRRGFKVMVWLTALLLLVWLYRQSSQVDSGLHVRTVDHFEQLRRQDAHLNQYVLQARYHLLRNYDPLVMTQRQIVQLLAALPQDAPQHFGPGDSQIQQEFTRYRQQFATKFVLLEEFKSHNAVLGNSMAYLSTAIQHWLTQLQVASLADHHQHDLLHHLLESLLRQDDANRPQTVQRIQQITAELTRMDRSNQMESLASHVAIILRYQARVDQLTQDITQSESMPLGDILFALYGRDYARRQQTVSSYRLAMALLAAAMMAYVAYGAWQMSSMRRTSRVLRDSLRELEFQKFALDAHSIVSISDPDGRILYVNDKLCEISQYSRAEMLGKDHRLFNAAHHPPEFFQDLWTTIMAGKVWHGEIKNRRKDGSAYWVDSTIVPFLDDQGRVLRHVSIRTDITERKEAEQAMVQAKEAAERANQIKSDFLANMSHEIRTPMNGIIGMTRLALDTHLTADQREYIGMVQTSANALLLIINDILDFSKIESGKMRIEVIVFSLRVMLRDALKPLALRANEKNLALRQDVAADVPDHIQGDPGRIRQVIVNLVGNAIKFTQSGEVLVFVHCLPGASEAHVRLRFGVQDTGIGIPEDKHETVFDAFAQADTSTTRQYGGTGLGLSISAKLVALMGGRIQLDSQPGKGSTFYFDLDFPISTVPPIQQTPATDATQGSSVRVQDDPNHDRPVLSPSPSPSKPIRPLTFLLAEDNTVNQKLAVTILTRQGHSVTVASNGQEAIRLWQSSPFDAVLMDVDMPVMNGYQATRRIRDLEKTTGGHIPILAMTAHAMQGAREECLRHGMDGYLSKPIGLEELWREIAQWVPDRPDDARPSTTPAAPPHGTRAVVNFDQMRQSVDQNRALFDDLVALYRADAPIHNQRIRDALQMGDASTVRSSAHAIRGMVAIFAAERTRAAAQRVENLAGQALCAEAVTDLEAAQAELLTALQQYTWPS